MSDQNVNTSSSDSTAATSRDEGSYTMVAIYSVLIVLLIIVLIWSCTGDEKFLPKQTKSDKSGDWDIISELARLNQIQEAILRKNSAASSGRPMNIV